MPISDRFELRYAVRRIFDRPVLDSGRRQMRQERIRRSSSTTPTKQRQTEATNEVQCRLKFSVNRLSTAENVQSESNQRLVVGLETDQSLQATT